MKNQTLEIYSIMKENILNGVYLPSESLTELDLSSKFQVSRNTVKKVLLMLEKESLITIEQNKSAKIRAFTIDEVLGCLELRCLLEEYVIEKAVANITPEQIEEMQRIHDNMTLLSHKGDLLEYSKCNKLFHEIIYNACSNPAAVEMVETIKNQINRYNFKTILIPGRAPVSLQEHGDILEAIKAGNAALAKEKMVAHICSVSKIISDNRTLIF